MQVVGGQATEQGDCSKFKLKIPHSCKRNPQVVDLLPGAPYNMQYQNCCKGGVLTSWGQEPTTAFSAFQIAVAQSGTSNKTVKLPKDFKFLGPGPGYSCGPAKLVPSTAILSDDHRRKSRALSKYIYVHPIMEIVYFLYLLSFIDGSCSWFECSVMECHMYLFSVSCLQEPKLLCFFLFFLQ